MVFEERGKWNSVVPGRYVASEKKEETQVQEDVLYVKRKLNAYD